MPENKPEPKIILDVDIVKSASRCVLPATGIFGALNNQGQLVAHFYVEYAEMPTTGKLAIDLSEHKVVENSLSSRPNHLNREIVATIVIPTSLTPAFAEWFRNQADLAATMTSIEMK